MPLNVLCELLLCTACLWAAYGALRASQTWRLLGFLLIGAAALLGAVHYAGVEQVATAHQQLSAVSGRLSLLLIALGAVRGVRRQALVLALGALMLGLPEQAALFGNLLALLAIGWPGRSQRWALACTGCLLFLCAGLAVGTRGEWLGIARLDLFHLTLLAAVLCWSFAGLCGTRWAWPWRPLPAN
ncbi:hypothetical protein JQX08_02695 [Pseudomonas sp. UL073]|uniref:Uncharacterized protein n=1 Tax=Zestomonas insulae TaxID=2809017 RepID=A0ABS2IAB7_9GAMM|nr:hypothetical protein [Pseudomonas insulae]MBM7059608.1 hypothetical protein [Pseudomonas insulae]